MIPTSRSMRYWLALQEQTARFIAQYRAKCKHPKAVKVPKASTGNYDPSCDGYWYQCTCPRCGKIWMEDQ